jgi:hypothetical protein
MAVVAKAVMKGISAETFIETHWQLTSLTSIHGLHLISLPLLFNAVKYRSTALLLTWFILTLILVAAHLACLVLGRNALLGQIPLLLFDVYCLWVVMAFRLFLLFMRHVHEDMTTLPAILARPVNSYQDRADGDIPLSMKDSTNDRFGYCVHVYSSSGYVQIPRIAFDMPAAEGCESTDDGYYRRCYYCPGVQSGEVQQNQNPLQSYSHPDEAQARSLTPAAEGATSAGGSVRLKDRNAFRSQSQRKILNIANTHDASNLISPLYNK